MESVIVWHRGDLRTHDHEALLAASQSRLRVIPLVVVDEHIFSRPDLSARRQAWFLENVSALRQSYEQLGANLVVRKGKPEQLLPELAKDWQCQKVFFLRSFTPYGLERDQKVTKALEEKAVTVESFDGLYGRSPGEICTQEGGFYKVYTPFMKRWREQERLRVVAAPKKLAALPDDIDIGEIPKVSCDIDLPEAGEQAALVQFETFQDEAIDNYHESRNIPSMDGGTSRLSMYLTLGVLSARLALQEANRHDTKGYKTWANELIWRDFNASLLYGYPEMTKDAFYDKWQGFPWRDDPDSLAAWQEGRTGYPFVDAGMRELNASGFMHNRVRMIVASFLCKHLLIDWRKGEAYFKRQLLDGDTAQNIGNWQWSAGSGADASPYFRVFNPISQVQKYDPEGHYIKHWCPELAEVPQKHLGLPADMPDFEKLNYPAPIVAHSMARERFLNRAKKHFD